MRYPSFLAPFVPICLGRPKARGRHSQAEVSAESRGQPTERDFRRGHAKDLGALTTARKPQWLGLWPVEKLALRSLRIIGDSVAPLGGSISNVFQHDPSKSSGPGGFERRAHLRVFSGGRGDFC